METILNDKKNLIVIYILMLISLFLTIFIIPNYLSAHSKIINLLIWFVIFLMARRVSNQHNRFKGRTEKYKSVIIIVAIYLLGYYLSGLIFGYNKTIYSHTFKSIFQNFIFYILVIMFQEYTRSRMINNTRSKILYTVITVFFIFFSFNYGNFLSQFATGESAFKFVANDIYRAIILGILCSFLVKVGSYKLSLLFILPLKLTELYVPIVPDIDWFLTIALESALVLITYYYINYEHLISIERHTRAEIKYGNPIGTIPAIAFVVIFALFIAGLFTYKPIALVSNSMKPYMQRGDVVIIKKIEKEEIKKLKVGDVIEYQLDDMIIIHRIYTITEGSGGERTFVTKGDANTSCDNKIVTEEQIKGIAKFYIPSVGYPSVIFSEKVLKKQYN